MFCVVLSNAGFLNITNTSTIYMKNASFWQSGMFKGVEGTSVKYWTHTHSVCVLLGKKSSEEYITASMCVEQ